MNGLMEKPDASKAVEMTLSRSRGDVGPPCRDPCSENLGETADDTSVAIDYISPLSGNIRSGSPAAHRQGCMLTRWDPISCSHGRVRDLKGIQKVKVGYTQLMQRRGW